MGYIKLVTYNSSNFNVYTRMLIMSHQPHNSVPLLMRATNKSHLISTEKIQVDAKTYSRHETNWQRHF